jgi:SAM-dependent methyltransferase
MAVTQAVRKKLGLYYTPPDLAEVLTARTLDDIETVGDWSDWPRGRPVRVLDPACGDGRLLETVRVQLHLRGFQTELVGCDVDADALARLRHPRTRTIHANALEHDWGDEVFDIVIGNPPYLSQMASETTRGGSSKHGGGPYADAAAEFLALSVRLADPGHGRVALVLPQSILASRDAGPIRKRVDELADLAWSWWVREQQLFDASVYVCMLGFRRPSTGPADALAWTSVVTDELGIPALDPTALQTNGNVGDRAELNLNFRDEYYALTTAVSDDADGPPLVTSGLIDPGVNRWGQRPVKFNKQRLEHPRVDLSKLDDRFVAWARRKLVPKVVVANQTRAIEAVADPDGEWIPSVPVITATPTATPDARRAVDEIEAVLTSPVASVMAWHLAAGTGMSTQSVRLTPTVIAAIPWPAGSLDDAVAALDHGDVAGCGRAVVAAYGLGSATELVSWWIEALPDRNAPDAAS